MKRRIGLFLDKLWVLWPAASHVNALAGQISSRNWQLASLGTRCMM
ncbi:MAG: hypothetical protein WB020_04200 [Candidatus Dormiibacterota bacterium]